MCITEIVSMLILTEVLSPVFIIVDGFLQRFKCMFLANVSVLASSTQFGEIGGAYPEFAIIIAIGLRGQESTTQVLSSGTSPLRLDDSCDGQAGGQTGCPVTTQGLCSLKIKQRGTFRIESNQIVWFS
jgi:hypothetical protein